MQPASAGELVTIDTGGTPLNGIVFDTPSSSKVVVAVVERGRGPVFRTVHPRSLSERAEAAADDPALRLLVKRTPSPSGATGRPGTGTKRGQTGHSRAATHRTTGR